MHIKKIEIDEREQALELVWNTFMRYEAPDYSDEGIATFAKEAIRNEKFLNMIEIYGAYEENSLRGIIATRNQGNHIALFFVDGAHHRQGIGKRLFNTIVENSTADKITVNSSPYAVDVYHHLGFVDTAPEQNFEGMRFTPMEYIK